MYRAHPGDAIYSGTGALQQLSAIPAEMVIHHYYDPLRAGQIRGIPAVVQAMIKAKDFDEYDDAELVRKKNRAAYTGAITRPKYEGDDDINPLTGLPKELDADGVPVDEIQAGSFFTMLPGEEIKLFDGDASGAGYADFVRQLLGIGAGQDVPYEFISWDFSKLNDRTLRVVLAEYHRIIEQDRWLYDSPSLHADLAGFHRLRRHERHPQSAGGFRRAARGLQRRQLSSGGLALSPRAPGRQRRGCAIEGGPYQPQTGIGGSGHRRARRGSGTPRGRRAIERIGALRGLRQRRRPRRSAEPAADPNYVNAA
jgi:hypothetical protein